MSFDDFDTKRTIEISKARENRFAAHWFGCDESELVEVKKMYITVKISCLACGQTFDYSTERQLIICPFCGVCFELDEGASPSKGAAATERCDNESY